MKLIPLTRGLVAKVDDIDFEILSQYKWQAIPQDDKFRAKRAIRIKNKVIHIFMHRMILNVVDHKISVDHINGDPLDNRRENLRICTNQQNQRNSGISKRNKSGYKGVRYANYKRGAKKWRAVIVIDKKNTHLGYFMTKEEAAKAYNIAALHYFGEFARINEIKD